jgi:hypothetical protein
MRNFLHYLAGFTMMFIIGWLTGFSTYTTSSKIIGVPLLSFTLGLVVGFLWELYQIASKQTIKIGWDDVFRTIVGSLIGGVLITFL